MEGERFVFSFCFRLRVDFVNYILLIKKLYL